VLSAWIANILSHLNEELILTDVRHYCDRFSISPEQFTSTKKAVDEQVAIYGMLRLVF
jgi:hypothetical protein